MIDLTTGAISLIIVAAAWFGTGYWLGARNRNNWWWNEMIRRRHALYHWEDGKVYWNEDEPKTPRDPAATKVRSVTSKGSGYGGGATMPIS